MTAGSAVVFISQKLPYDPAIPLLGIYLERTITQKDACTPMFIVALFTIGRTQKQPGCPSEDDWVMKFWYKYTVEYDSAIKGNTSEAVLMRWMNLEPVIHGEISQKEKD